MKALKPVFALLSALLSALLLAGCDCMFASGETSWKEEVQLSSGTKIWVKRTAKGEASCQLGGPNSYEVNERELEVIASAGLPVPPKWSSEWRDMVLDRDKDGAWYLVVSPVDTRHWISKLPYAQFKAIDGKWQQVEFDKSLDGRDANLEYTLKVGKMPEKIFLNEKPLGMHRDDFYRDVPSRYRAIDLDVKHW